MFKTFLKRLINMQRHDQLLKHAYMCLNAVIPKMCMVKN